jgi:RNA polymerase sigma-70 factor, ECF subfamily
LESRDEQQLLDRAILGDEESLAVLLECAGVRLRSEIQARIGITYRGVVEADDVLQVTFLEAFLRIRSFAPGNSVSFVSWLKRIADNNLRDAIRAVDREKRPSPTRRVRVAAGDDSYFSLLESLAGSATTVSQAANRNEIRQAIDEALRKLPKDYEQVLRLYELQGLSACEVAVQMGRSHGAVRMLLARARDCLGEIIGSESQYF